MLHKRQLLLCHEEIWGAKGGKETDGLEFQTVKMKGTLAISGVMPLVLQNQTQANETLDSHVETLSITLHLN